MTQPDKFVIVSRVNRLTQPVKVVTVSRVNRGGVITMMACQLAPYLLSVAPSLAQLPPPVFVVAQHAQFLHVSQREPYPNGRALSSRFTQRAEPIIG